ncbi:MAG: 2-C-methyl-D-erythritol 2,4-cyclodiphosphate synthase [Dehalococcoidia bacterium]|nr:MAG: 2-C-methyl-D-erythritol 2,4-cyclodiphosphate synthase [Dehalococcoidia bacterium]
MRIGIGYDAHRLARGRSLVLGGVEIPFEQGLEGWSDADVVVHAIIDALLGAAALGDIGTHFPTNDPAYEGISSIVLLGHTRNLLKEQGWRISNIDATIIAERPLIHPFVDQMRQNISQALSISKSQVGIKATTTEGLGFTGREEGIATYSVALLEEA